MISVRDLTVVFGDRTVLDGINLEIRKGEVLALMGKNGTGKSVLLKAIAGLNNNYEGYILIDGIEMKAYHGDEGSPTKKDGVRLAYVFQKGGLFDSMNIFENIAFGIRRGGADTQNVDTIVLEALKRVGLAGNEKKLPSELSGGMQKRVGIARAICLNPDVILYDDPTAGLDPILSDSIADLIMEVTAGFDSTSIVVTHDLKVAEKIAARTALIYEGKIVFDGSTEEFFQRENPYSRQFIEGNADGPIDMY